MIIQNHIWNCTKKVEEGNFENDIEMSNISIQNKFEFEVEKMINGVFYEQRIQDGITKACSRSAKQIWKLC